MSYSKAILVGRLGADPEIRFTTSGTATASFRVAVDAGWGERKRTDWHRCTAWQKTAENIGKHLRKGSLVLVEGRLENREWNDKDGNKRQVTEVIVDRWQLVGPKPKEEQGTGYGSGYDAGSGYGSQGGGDDSVPF